MAGTLWVKTPDGKWTVAGVPPLLKTSTGWKRIPGIWSKTGASTWTQRYSRDVTPPAKPVSVSFTMKGADLTVAVKAPVDSTVAKIVQRVGYTGYPTSYNDGTYGATVPVASGGTAIKVWPSQKVGTVQYWSFFTVDTSGNVSVPLIYKYTVPKIVVAPTTVNRNASFMPADSASYNAQSDYWRSDNNYVYQGGLDWHGMWFYSTRISGALAKAIKVTYMAVSVTRANTVHGVSGPANVYLSAHTAYNQPSGDPSGYDTNGIYVGTLNRGETKTFVVPSAYYAGFANNTYKGLGLQVGATSYTDARYLYALGAGSASSGRVYVEWTE